MLATSEDAADRKEVSFMKGLFRIVDMKRWYLCPQVRVADTVQLNGNIRPRSRQWQCSKVIQDGASQWHAGMWLSLERRSFALLQQQSWMTPVIYDRNAETLIFFEDNSLRQAGAFRCRSGSQMPGKPLQMTGEWLNVGADGQSPEHRS